MAFSEFRAIFLPYRLSGFCSPYLAAIPPSRSEIVQAPLRNLQQTGVGGEHVVGALVSLEGALEGQGCPHFHCDVCGAAKYELDGGGILLRRLEDFDWNSGPDFAEEALQREGDVVGQVGDADINGCARLGRREAPM